MSPKGPPSIFFFIFCNQLEFHKARRVLPFQFWALDMAPTLAVLGLLELEEANPKITDSRSHISQLGWGCDND